MLESGQALSARFILDRRLGTGGSGEVWLAQDRERACRIAVKILIEELARHPAALAALERECELARALEDPHVLRIEGLYRSAEHAWIAMEYASGGDLTQLRGAAPTQILRAAVPIASALATVHRAGLVHRDVKPANVLLSADGTPRLTDFGIALALACAPGAAAGRGSPYSMSPQQLAGEPASIADDIYGLGAMLYELLSGYPPFYATARTPGVRPATLPSTVPSAVSALVERLLAEDPQDRPRDMSTVERELREVLAHLPAPAMIEGGRVPPRVEPPHVRTPIVHGEPLRAEWRRGGARERGARELHRQGFRSGLAVAAGVLGIASVGVVFFALPEWVAKEPLARYAPAASAVVPEPPPQAEEKEQIDFAAMARAKQQADDQRAVAIERLQKLEERAAAKWAEAEVDAARWELAAGDEDYEAREYIDAAGHFAALGPMLDALEQRADVVLAAELARGAAALKEGRSKQAHEAFALVLEIEPGHVEATRGLKRAGTLDEVSSLIARAAALEDAGRDAEALASFGKALALDALAPGAADGIARIEAQQSRDVFATAMARGYAALAGAEYESARSAFEAARKIRPGAPEIAQALQQIEQEQRTRVIAAKLSRAGGHEAEERWAQALAEYRAVVELDSTVAAAQEGVARVTPRAELNEQLELYLTQPERLFSQPVRVAARETLAQAGRIADPGPLLTRQLATLRDWIARADVPVPIALESDNLTQVTIYRVGKLGTFAQHSLELRPGRYTLVGTRPGFRDVRREIDVVPGAPLDPIVIRCEDRI